MKRKAFFRSLILGGIILPHIPKLILTGGWFQRGFMGSPIVGTEIFGIDNDFTFNALTGDIRYIGAKERQYTVLGLHRWIQKQADQETSMDGSDMLDITHQNPSYRINDHLIELVGAVNIDEETAKWIKDGSLIQNRDAEHPTIYDGFFRPPSKRRNYADPSPIDYCSGPYAKKS